MGNITYYLNQSYIKADGTCAIYLITYCKGKQVKLPTKVWVNPVNGWDWSANKIKGTSTEVKDDNLILKDCYARLTDIFVRARLQHKALTPAIIKKEYDNPNLHGDFYKFWESEMKDKKDGKDIKHATWEQHKAVLSKLKLFMPVCSFAELNDDFLKKFQRFCRYYKWINPKTNKEEVVKNNQNTINKNLKVISVYVNLALRQEKLKKSPFEDFEMIKPHPEILFLEEHELNKLIDYYKKNLYPSVFKPTLRRFLFSCFTGLRISDSLNLSYDNIIGTTLVIKPVKTDKLMKIVRIPLTIPALELLGNYENKKGLVFPKMTEQTINKHLKKIADLTGITKPLKFHSGRHTFATIYYRATTDIKGLQDLLGHSDIRYTMVYTHVVQIDTEKRIKELNKFWLN